MEIAKFEDIPKLTKLFCAELSKAFSVEQDSISDLLLRIIGGADSEAWIKKDKFMVGVIQPSIYNPTVKVANCLFFRGANGDKKTFEDWAKDKKVTQPEIGVVMFTLPKQNKPMKDNGYKPIEIRYVKEI